MPAKLAAYRQRVLEKEKPGFRPAKSSQDPH
jgi:hypothetical protein